MKLTGTTLWNNNFQNLFNIGVISLTNGQIMQRDSLEEQIHYQDLENHPDNSKLTKRTNNLFLIEGKAKFYWKWQDSENITNNDIEFLANLNKNNPEDSKATFEQTDNSYSFTYDYTEALNNWTTKTVPYELKSSIAGIEGVNDKCKILCFVQFENKWNFQNQDIVIGETATATKESTDTYLFFSQDCEVNGNIIPADTFKKLTSDSINIKNISDKICKIVKVYL